MAAHSDIEWCDATWQVASGCTPVSEGCRLCYSARLVGTRLKAHAKTKGLVKRMADGRYVFNGKIRVHEDALTWPMLWRGAPAALAAGRRSRIFVADRTDLFHEAMPDAAIVAVFATMALSPRHDFIVLTKRASRMRALVGRLEPMVRKAIARLAAEQPRLCLKIAKQWEGRSPFDFGVPWPLKNVWLGVSVEDQAAADERIPDLIATPAAKRLLSCEPLLGPIKIALHTFTNFLDWVIVGGESGTGARPMHPAWARALRDQCAAAGVAFFFKQWGAFAPAPVTFDEFMNPRKEHLGERLALDGGELGSVFPERRSVIPAMRRVGKRHAGRELDGRTHDGFPASNLGEK